jgi:hypothetical protein
MIDHARGGHDDIANAVAGACVLALSQGGAMPVRGLPSHAIDAGVYDPLASPAENRLRLIRAEARAGYFTGPGWAPIWHVSGMDLQTHAINED